MARTNLAFQSLANLDHATISRRLVSVIDYMATQGLDTVSFLHYLSWNLEIPGHMVSEQSTIRYARTALMHCEQLPGILKNWHKPPRGHERGVTTRGALNAMNEWAVDNVKARLNREMREFAPQLESPPEDMSEEYLLGIRLKDDIERMKTMMPTYWDIMDSLSCTPLQKKRRKTKDHEPRIFISGTILHYNRSQRRCRYQKFLSIYLKSCGLAAKANDTTHLFGFTMSQKWVYAGIVELSESNRRRMIDDIIRYVFFGGHDNLNIPFRVYEMRNDHQNHFDNGTCGTIYIVKDPTAIAPNRIAYMAQRAAGCQNPITARDVFMHEIAAGPRIREDHIYIIKKQLLLHPAFADWEHRTHPLFTRPDPVQQLPTGKEHATCQYMLDTVHMEEASQEGNRRVLQEWLRQLDLDGERALREPFLDRLIVWIGDQLTTVRIRSVKRDRSFDMNHRQRFEQFFEIYGWFHTQLNEEMTIRKQHYGTSENLGLKHAFNNMGRKSLHAAATVQGTFHYDFRSTLKHTAEARFRDIWATVSDVEDLADLTTFTPHALHELAVKIFEDFASTAAIEKVRKCPRAEQDDLLIQGVMFCRDVLNYLNFDDAMSTGDVGRMELMLPRLLFRFHGSGSHNYTHEVLEIMQGLWREWPDDLKSFLMRYCWLANTTGHENGFLAYDMVQEHNVRDIKVIFGAHGPYATWDYIKKISASIPTQRKLKDHVEHEFNHFRRGKSHTSPEHEGDVVLLQGKYREANAHVRKPGRHLPSDERIKDVFLAGCNPNTLEAMMKRWADGRVQDKSTTEDFDTPEMVLQRLDNLALNTRDAAAVDVMELEPQFVQ
ncbi:hypothetical protein BC835DRAFT_1509188 [Cytidiella melzeri]|nr:hypothetical protein BC835DRAFT_1509188 [Cytidiella melzeri]